jgi:hypothetical protein
MITKKIFLASSSELQDDREEFQIFIDRKKQDWADKGVFLELVTWQDFLDAVSITSLQYAYDKVISKYDILVMLFWIKVGKHAEDVFEATLRQFKATSKPLLLTYFKDSEISVGNVTKNDLMSLWAFQTKLRDHGHFVTAYKNVDDLKFQFNQQLDKLVGNGIIELSAGTKPMTAQAEAQRPARVFISYRRDDAPDVTGRIYDHVWRRFGKDHVFFDIDSIKPGTDFTKYISEQVGACDALVVIIGRGWLTAVNEQNERRLDDPNDFVRIEIETALSRDIPVIPVLVSGEVMPKEKNLPETLKRLARRQSVEISSYARFGADVRKLINALPGAAGRKHKTRK